MARLYDVPTDVVQFVIFPYLDKESRFIANDVLHPSRQIEYRFPSRIEKDDIIRHATYIACTILDPLINTSDKFTMQNLIYLFLKILNGHADILLQYNPKFRRVAREKVRQYSNIHYVTYRGISKGFKKGAVNLSKRILERFHTIPYIRYVCGSSVYSVKN